jgi:hypothetical protein
MNKISKYLTFAVLIIALVIVISTYLNIQTTPALGGGSAQDFTYKTITSSTASTTHAVGAIISTVVSGSKILGSITVSSSSPTALRVYNNTTASSSATLIAELPARVSAQTFNFDIAVNTGIAVEVPNTFSGVYTITYK